MMNQEESMRNLRRLLDDMQQILNKKNKSPHLHALEIDLLKQKTLNIYDTLIHLNPSSQSAQKPLQNAEKKQPPEPKPVPSAPLTSEVSTPEKKTESHTGSFFRHINLYHWRNHSQKRCPWRTTANHSH